MDLLLSLTVNYIIETEDRDDFFDCGRLRPDIQEQLESRFPKQISLSPQVRGERHSLTHMPMTEGQNFVRCALCGRPLSTSVALYLGLDAVTAIDGQPYCSSCAYDMKIDRLRESAGTFHINPSFSNGDE